MNTSSTNVTLIPAPPIKLKPSEKKQYWARHIRQWETSGDTQQDYCRQHQLKLHQLVYWKRVLSPHSKTSTNKAAFVSVQLTQPLALTSPDVSSGLVIELPSGIRIQGVHTENLPLIQVIMGWPT